MKTITEHYSEMYLSNTRWLSYIAQIASLEGVNINKIAEIGIGPNVMNFIVKKTVILMNKNNKTCNRN